MKKTLAGIGIIAVFAVAGIAFAQNMMQGSEAGMPSSLMMMHPPQPMVLTVSASGHGLLRGVVESVATDSISVAAWGGTWTVKITGNTTISPSGGLPAIEAGDFIGVLGSVSEDSPTITADLVRDWDPNHMMHGDHMMMDEHMMGTSTMMHEEPNTTDIQNHIQQILQKIKMLQSQINQATTSQGTPSHY